MPFPKTEDELARAGYTYEGTRKCIGPNCGAEITWYKTPRNKYIPLNPDLTPHWTTCPDAESFR